MKVLIVYSGNRGLISPFVKEQAEAISKIGVDIAFFAIRREGAIGYLLNLPLLKRTINVEKPDIVHAHYGFSGLLASLQHAVPVIVTFHGSDINVKTNKKYSFLASRLSKANIFVHPNLPKKILYKKKPINIIPCGVDLEIFYPEHINSEARDSSLDKKTILFSSPFDNHVKNYPLARKAVDLLNGKVNLVELTGYSRSEVALLMNSVDLLLVTSRSETGPLVVKEAMACNCPIVSTDVGDVRDVIGNTEGCYITTFDPEDVAEKIKLALDFSEKKGRTQGRKRIIDLRLDSESVAKRIINVYEQMLNRG